MFYLASPYRHPDAATRVSRYRDACLATAALLAHGHAVFSPIAHSVALSEFTDIHPDIDWIDYDLWYLERCAALLILALPGWEESEGVRREREFAERVGLPIFWLDPADDPPTPRANGPAGPPAPLPEVQPPTRPARPGTTEGLLRARAAMAVLSRHLDDWSSRFVLIGICRETPGSPRAYCSLCTTLTIDTALQALDLARDYLLQQRAAPDRN